MNILMICDYLAGDIEGGSDRVLYEYSTRLKKRGHTVMIIAGDAVRSREKDVFSEEAEISRYRIGKSPALRFFQALAGCRKTFAKINQKIKLDTINFHQPLSAFAILCLGAPKRIHKVYTFHSPWHREYEIANNKPSISRNMRSFLRKRMERFCLHRCNRIITLSEYMKAEAIKIHNIKAEKIVVIPGGVDIEKFKPPSSKAEAKRKLSFPEDKFIMLTVRNFRKRTGLIEFIKACRRILEKDKGVILVMVGDGPLKEEAEAIINDYGLKSRIIITGFVPEGLLLSYYQASDLFVMPTQKLEGFGLALVEALSSGLPVLATPVGGITEVLSGMDKDSLFEDTSQDSLSKGVERIMNDRKAMERMAAKSRDYAVNRYSWEKIIPKLEKVLQR